MDQFAIALGMFDGVHIGHRALIKRTVAIAGAEGDRSVVFTYENHPKELFLGSFDYVSTLKQRRFLFSELGVDSVDTVPFTQDLSRMTPYAFIAFLMERYRGRISAIVCGYDYRFGKDAAGDRYTLTELAQEFGFRAAVIDPVLYEGKPVSSTRVRQAIRDGNMLAASDMLLRPYTLSGTIVHHQSIGRRIGYPTANLIPQSQILPKDGVYATALIFDHTVFPSVTNIGYNPTVGGTERTIETHVLDVGLDLYGSTVSVLFFERLREEIRFGSTADLALQIGKDTSAAQKIYMAHEKSVYKYAYL